MRRLRRPEVCGPETFQELIRTPTIQQRVLALGIVKKPVSEADRRREELGRLLRHYGRAALDHQVWAEPVQNVPQAYGISGVRLGKVCRTLEVPVPPRGYWARVRKGYTIKSQHCQS